MTTPSDSSSLTTRAPNLRLDHLNLSVTNFEETASWYRDVFGFTIVEKGLYDGRPWGVIRAGDSMLCIYQSPERIQLDEEDERHHRINHFAFRLTDEKLWLENARRLKLKFFYGGKVEYSHSVSYYVEDPSGYSIEVAFWENDQVSFV